MPREFPASFGVRVRLVVGFCIGYCGYDFLGVVGFALDAIEHHGAIATSKFRGHALGHSSSSRTTVIMERDTTGAHGAPPCDFGGMIIRRLAVCYRRLLR